MDLDITEFLRDYYRLIAVLLLVPFAGVYLYRRALPRPIPGIPHRGTHRKLWGDLPDLIANRKITGQSLEWMNDRTQELNSPLIQLFLRPFAPPLLVMNDFRETEDIITRRMHQFDTSPTATFVFGTVIPEATISMPSHDRFKSQRRLWAGTMTTEFLHRVAAPRVFDSGQKLVELWRQKTKMSPDTPFDALLDLRYTALDAIWAAAVGSDLGGLASRLDALVSYRGTVPVNEHGAAQFPEPAMPPLALAIDLLLESLANLSANPMALLTRFIQAYKPDLRAAHKMKDDTMGRLLREARLRFQGSDAQERKPTCAMEQVLQREVVSKEKSSFMGEATSDKAMIDELFVWLVAGHETTVTTMGWGFKHLCENLDVQRKLRHSIIDETGATSIPSADQILNADLPYLEATAWEMLRLARTAAAVMRVTTVDTDILGHQVPQGTQILLSTSGFAALDEKHLPVNEAARSRSSQLARRTNTWDLPTLKNFDPERWLKTINGKVEFDMNAGPVLSFGGGPRGCFGRRLAMIELKLFIASLVMAFDFQPLPDALNSYEGRERITRQPLMSYVRLRNVS